MTPEEFKKQKAVLDDMIDAAEKRIKELKVQLKEFKENYVSECLEKSPYEVGQKVKHGDKTLFVSGAYEFNGGVFLQFNRARKDGKMSQKPYYGGLTIRIG